MTSSIVEPQAEADDIQIFFDDEDQDSAESRTFDSKWRWATLVAPWLWFLVKGVHPWVEVAAILLPVLTVGAALGCLLLAAYRRSGLLLGLTLSLCLMTVVAVGLPRRPIESPAPTESSRFAALNVARRWHSCNDIGYFLQIREVDVVVGTELSEPHDAELRERYEYAVSDLVGFDPVPEPVGGLVDLSETYRLNDGPSIGLYANFEIQLLEDPIRDDFAGGLPGFRALLKAPEGDIVVYALHIPRPGTGSADYEVSISEQRELVEAVTSAVEAEELPVVVLGDLNIVDRGESFDILSNQLRDVMRSNTWAPSTRESDVWHSLLQLRIDHLLIDRELCAMEVQAPAVFFSDHRPIQADIGPCPEGE